MGNGIQKGIRIPSKYGRFLYTLLYTFKILLGKVRSLIPSEINKNVELYSTQLTLLFLS